MLTKNRQKNSEKKKQRILHRTIPICTQHDNRMVEIEYGLRERSLKYQVTWREILSLFIHAIEIN